MARALACGVQSAGIAKSARNLSSAPNGTAPAGPQPVAKRAGQRACCDSLAPLKLTRSAWRISPDEASAAFASNGVIGNPEALAEPQPFGRSASDFKSQAAVAIAYHWFD